MPEQRPPEDGSKVGQRIAAQRTALGMPRLVLAELVGISRSHLSNLEHGHRDIPPELLTRIAHALGVDPDALRGDR